MILTACSAKQVRCPFFSIGSDASSGTVYSLQTILFLRKLCRLTFLLQIEAIHGLIRFCTHSDFPTSQQFLNAIRSTEAINLKQFEITLRERIILGSWRELDNLTPYETHQSSRIMRTYHKHFGEPLGIAPGWWDDRKRSHKPVLPIYLRLDVSNVLSRAISCLCLSGHNCLIQRMRHNRNRRPHELRICDKCDWHSVQDEENILLDCPHEHLISIHTPGNTRERLRLIRRSNTAALSVLAVAAVITRAQL